METVYKVVEKHYPENTYCSCYAIQEFRHDYRIGEKTTAHKGKLFVFKRLYRAKAFRRQHHEMFIILRCETDKLEVPEFTRIPSNMRIKDIHAFWGRKKRLALPVDMALPEGTVLCKSLTPIAVCKN